MKKFTEISEMKMSSTLITYITYKFMLILKKPFKDWPAFEAGLIDEKGVLLRKAKTKEEKEALDPLSNLTRKLKRLLGKYIPNEKLLGFLITVYLLKNDIQNPEHNALAEKVQNYLSADENKLVYDMVKESQYK